MGRPVSSSTESTKRSPRSKTCVGSAEWPCAADSRSGFPSSVSAGTTFGSTSPLPTNPLAEARERSCDRFDSVEIAPGQNGARAVVGRHLRNELPGGARRPIVQDRSFQEARLHLSLLIIQRHARLRSSAPSSRGRISEPASKGWWFKSDARLPNVQCAGAPTSTFLNQATRNVSARAPAGRRTRCCGRRGRPRFTIA